MNTLPPRREFCGFTLTELLVVLAIMALLAALLFPTFAQVREKSRQAACLSNVRQIGMALTLYRHDFDEHLPVATETGPNGSGVHIWHTDTPQTRRTLKNAPKLQATLAPYTKENALWHCPSDIGGQENLYRAADQDDPFIIYAQNSFYEKMGSSYAYRTEAGFVDTLEQAKAEDFAQNPLSLAQVVLVMDKCSWHMARHPNALKSFFLPDEDNEGSSSSGFRTLLFADGHAKAVGGKDAGLLWLGSLGVP